MVIQSYIEFNILNESLNEGFDIKTIQNMIEKVKNKNLFSQVVNMFNKAVKKNKKIYFCKLLVIIYILNISANIPKTELTDIKLDNIGNQMANIHTFDYDYFKKLLDSNFNINKEKTKILYPKFENEPSVMLYYDPQKLKTSEDAKQFIKEHEALRLKGYDLGDGRILIGYGHYGNGIGKNVNYKVGEVITLKKAEKLFNDDIKQKEYELKRLLRKWKNEEGIDIRLTQNMFDCMISMSYNMGIYAFRDSEFAKELKNGNFQEAAELIKSTNMSSFPGLKDRRFDEYQLFVKDIV